MGIKKQRIMFGIGLLCLFFSNLVAAPDTQDKVVAPPSSVSASTPTSTPAPNPASSDGVSNPTAPNAPAISPEANSPNIGAQMPVEAGILGDIELGKAKSQVCAACHGVDGNSTVPTWPKIAEQGKLYLVKELIEYRKGNQGHRFEPSMYAMVQNLSDQDIEDLAAYFASQTMSPGSAKADLVTLGEKIYRGGNLETGVPACAACHGAKGEGNNLAKFPRLSGQHADYTLVQLKKFKTKARSDDPNSIMQDISQRMSEDEMKAVSSYVSGLH